nr:TolC family protein [Sphingomonas japonica]
MFEAVGRATNDYPAIESGRTSVRAATAEVSAAKSLRLPSLGVQGVALGTGPGLGSQLVVDQPIYTFGRIGAAIDRAKAEKLARSAQVDETVQQVALDVVEAYFDIARLAQRKQILDANLEELRGLVQSIQNRVDQEVSPDTDLALAQSRFAQAEQDRAIAESQQGAAIERLYQYVGDAGYDPGAVPTYDPAVHHPLLPQAVDEALRCSPERDRLSAEALVAREEARQVRASVLPQLSAQFSYNDIIGARAGLAVTAQTQGGLSDFRRADAARLRATSAELDVRTIERQVREQVRTDLVQNATARSQISASASAADSAQRVTASFLRQFVAGRRTWLDVMNAVREATTSQLERSDSEFVAMASTARLMLRTCRWQPQTRMGGGSYE